jgi:hypothetical protein
MINCRSGRILHCLPVAATTVVGPPVAPPGAGAANTTVQLITIMLRAPNRCHDSRTTSPSTTRWGDGNPRPFGHRARDRTWTPTMTCAFVNRAARRGFSTQHGNPRNGVSQLGPPRFAGLQTRGCAFRCRNGVAARSRNCQYTLVNEPVGQLTDLVAQSKRHRRHHPRHDARTNRCVKVRAITMVSVRSRRARRSPRDGLGDRTSSPGRASSPAGGARQPARHVRHPRQ